MATVIKTIKDLDDNVIMPRTRAEAVTTSTNETVESELAALRGSITDLSDSVKVTLGPTEPTDGSWWYQVIE